ncbi:MAG: hypothetical protein MZW92_53930 [Comamonadaceae bacterium]|nr:hypothetical protein [Comamonadaceae bacterium]
MGRTKRRAKRRVEGPCGVSPPPRSRRPPLDSALRCATSRPIIFDLDDTLWEVGPVIVRAEHAMLRLPRRALPARARAAHARLDARPARAHGTRAPGDAPRLHLAPARVAAPPRARGRLSGGDGRGGVRGVLSRAQRGDAVRRRAAGTRAAARPVPAVRHQQRQR